jgi:hypothetical protein
MLSPSVLEQGFAQLFTAKADSPQTFAQRFMQTYERYARTALAAGYPCFLTGAERLRGVSQLLGALPPASQGAPSRAARAFVSAVTAFWLGTVFGPGVVTAFLGGPALLGSLAGMRPDAASSQAAKNLARAFDLATRMVQVTLPAPPYTAFLV